MYEQVNAVCRCFTYVSNYLSMLVIVSQFINMYGYCNQVIDKFLIQSSIWPKYETNQYSLCTKLLLTIP